MAESNEERWLLLIHQLPPKPHYFRVKIWRRLQRLGAVAIKNSVYVLPKNDQTQEDFQWVVREIIEGGKPLCAGAFCRWALRRSNRSFVQAARLNTVNYRGGSCLAEIPLPDGQLEDDRRTQSEVDLARPKRRLAEVVAIDFWCPWPQRRRKDSSQELKHV